MNRWEGAAAVCLNDRHELLMVLQGAPGQRKTWSVPSGKRKEGESLAECCIREVYEETGYVVEVVKKLHQKTFSLDGWQVIVPYFEVHIIGGSPMINDPDGLIFDVRWIPLTQLDIYELTFVDEQRLLMKLVQAMKKCVV